MSRTLSEWLSFMDGLNPRAMVLGLQRVAEVQARMGLAAPPFAVLTVAGTNGKGSTVTFLEETYLAAGYRTGAYLSPHLTRFNERVRCQGQEVEDRALVAALEAVECARGTVPLTYFEFATLAAAEVFRRAEVQIAVLEVGLGGRLDAVNAFDPLVAVVTSIGLDHMEYLGPDREAIGREKAGIFRAGRPAVCGDPDPPASIAEEAARVGAPLWQMGRDFGYLVQGAAWSWQGAGVTRSGLPLPAMVGPHQLRNASCARAALSLLQERWPVSAGDFRRALSASVPGRFDVRIRPGKAMVIFDVAHNGAAATALADTLQQFPGGGRTIAVCGMLQDKPLRDVALALRTSVDAWHLVGLSGPRGLSAAGLAGVWAAAGMTQCAQHPDPETGFQQAERDSGPSDRILVFGSFQTVGAIMARAEFVRRSVP